MNIIWQYLDKRSAAVNALKDYSSMAYILAHTDEEIAQVHEDTTTLGSPAFTDMPGGSPNPQSGEMRIIAAIDEIDVLRNGIVRQRNTWNGFSLHGTACRRMNGMCWNSSMEEKKKNRLMLFTISVSTCISNVLQLTIRKIVQCSILLCFCTERHEVI